MNKEWQRTAANIEADLRELAGLSPLPPEVQAIRYRHLTPIGRCIPLKGTYHRQVLMLHVAFRRLGRVLVRDIPGAAQVPWTKVGQTWSRWLQWLGYAYLVWLGLLFIIWLVSR